MNIFDAILEAAIDYNYVSPIDIKEWSEAALWMVGLLSVAIFFPIISQAPKKAAQKFKIKHPNEEIIYVTKNTFIFTFAVLFMFGGCVGKYILPVVYFKNTLNIINFTTYCWLFVLFITIVAIWFVGFRFSITYVFSDKKIELVSAFNFYDKIIKQISIRYEDILDVYCDSFLIFKWVTIIKKKNKEYFTLHGFADIKKMEKIIKENIKKGDK